jgi:hypothetical protein
MITKLILQRKPFEDGQPTFGVFMLEEGNRSVRMTRVRSIELPWKDNENSVSCIPDGEYTLRWTRSTRFSAMKGRDVHMWLVDGVKGRAGIRIHSGNYAGEKLTDSLGCILPCVGWADINKDGVVDGTASKKATTALLDILAPFKGSGLAFSVRNAPVMKKAAS